MTDGPDEFPTDEELPDEPVTVDDIYPFCVDDEDYNTIDEFAVTELKNSRNNPDTHNACASFCHQ